MGISGPSIQTKFTTASNQVSFGWGLNTASLLTENEQGIPIVLSNIISSQIDVHKEFGGVVPELAARSHIDKIEETRVSHNDNAFTNVWKHEQ